MNIDKALKIQYIMFVIVATSLFISLFCGCRTDARRVRNRVESLGYELESSNLRIMRLEKRLRVFEFDSLEGEPGVCLKCPLCGTRNPNTEKKGE